MLRLVWLLLLLQTIVLCLYSASSSPVSIFVLIGGTNDLSAKYLWNALYRQIYNTSRRNNVKLYTSGRTENFHGQVKLNTVLQHLNCTHDITGCTDFVDFASSIEYRKLENDIDYGRFCAEIFQNAVKQSLNIVELLWYLATPPTYYPVVLMSLHTWCRNSTARLKVALEKPFWVDNGEYISFSRIISGRFQPHELFFIDHYLAKETSMTIEKFKAANSGWLKIRNLERLELFLLERKFVSDLRLKFYEAYGVVRDVVVSHLNHIMLMLLNDDNYGLNLYSPNLDPDDELDSLRDILHRLRPFAKSDWILAQHKIYRNMTRFQSKTPTFSNLRLRFDVSRDSGDILEKDIVVVAGKYMEFTSSYARLLLTNKEHLTVEEIIFLFNSPLILLNLHESRNVSIPDGWILEKDSIDCKKWISRLLTSTPCSRFIMLKKPVEETPINLYEKIIDEFLKSGVNRNSSIFSKMSILEQSWKILWNHVMKELYEKLSTKDELGNTIEKENAKFQLKFYEKDEDVLNLAVKDFGMILDQKVEL